MSLSSSLRAAVARIPGARYLAERWGFVAPRVGYDDRATSPEVREELRALARANRTSRSSVVDPASPVVVSMTTTAARIGRAHLALESIARGAARPARLMLWLDDASIRPPAGIRRLQRRGLEVLQAEPGNRVHTKYYPYAASLASHTHPLVTSDDDMIYPVGWLADLVAAGAARPDAVHVHRAHYIQFEGEEFAPYLRWTPCTTTEPTYRAFGTSVSGQWLPPRLLDRLRDEGTRFREVALRADDIWIHRVAVAAGIPIAQVTTVPQNYPFVPRTQGTGLYFDNAFAHGNDEQIAATYSDDERAAIRSSR